ncbi:MAG: glutathione peroxidase [Candidatus Hydrogenedentes bacterium]|nr:glutathione peroxidase [Candidatus Hydrogenedentota bacterium]
MKLLTRIACLSLAAVMAALIPVAIAEDAPANVLGFKTKTIDGEEVALDKYKGKVMLIVNVASKCGLTPQYEQLQALHDKYNEKGLAVLGFPANNFNGQEPGTEAEIKEFCSSKFQVKFDMFSKVSVKGDDIAPLFKFLTSADTNKDFAGDIKWNFTKFLVDREGKVIARFEPKTTPDAAEVVAAIEKALAAAPAAGGDDDFDELLVGPISGQAVL